MISHELNREKGYLLLASFLSSRVGEEEREPGTHCLRMCQVPLVTCILLHYTKIKLQREKLCQSRAIAFSWKPQTHG